MAEFRRDSPNSLMDRMGGRRTVGFSIRLITFAYTEVECYVRDTWYFWKGI